MCCDQVNQEYIQLPDHKAPLDEIPAPCLPEDEPNKSITLSLGNCGHSTLLLPQRLPPSTPSPSASLRGMQSPPPQTTQCKMSCVQLHSQPQGWNLTSQKRTNQGPTLPEAA